MSIGRSYPEGPYQYSRAEDVLIEFASDEAVAKRLLPPQVESDAGLAYLKVSRHRASTFGPYTGLYIGLLGIHQGQPVRFMLSGLKTDWAGAVAGREVWGFPFSVGEVDMAWRGNLLTCEVRGHTGHHLASFNLMTTARSKVGSTAAVGMHSAVERDYEGNVVQRVILSASNEFEAEGVETWDAEATLRFGIGSPLDDWSILPVREVVRAQYSTGGRSSLGPARIVDTWPF